MNESSKLDFKEMTILQALEYGYEFCMPGSKTFQGVDCLKDNSFFLPFGLTLNSNVSGALDLGVQVQFTEKEQQSGVPGSH